MKLQLPTEIHTKGVCCKGQRHQRVLLLESVKFFQKMRCNMESSNSITRRTRRLRQHSVEEVRAVVNVPKTFPHLATIGTEFPSVKCGTPQRSSSGAWRGFMRQAPCNEGLGVWREREEVMRVKISEGTALMCELVPGRFISVLVENPESTFSAPEFKQALVDAEAEAKAARRESFLFNRR